MGVKARRGHRVGPGPLPLPCPCLIPLQWSSMNFCPWMMEESIALNTNLCITGGWWLRGCRRSLMTTGQLSAANISVTLPPKNIGLPLVRSTTAALIPSWKLQVTFIEKEIDARQNLDWPRIEWRWILTSQYLLKISSSVGFLLAAVLCCPVIEAEQHSPCGLLWIISVDFQSIYFFVRVPTAPGKPGKIGPDLENLEKQGVFWQKPGKILQNLEKNFDFTLKKPKRLNRRSIWKNNLAQARGPRFFFVYLDKGLGIIGFCQNFKNVL